MSEPVAPISHDDQMSVATPARAPKNLVPKDIATLPPLETIEDAVELSPTTGEPRRHPVIISSVLLGYLSGVATAGMYAHSWWLAAHQDTFAESARLITWVDPTPGKWPALLLVSAVAGLAALMVAAPAIISYNTWFGRRWVRWGGFVSICVTLIGTVLLSNWGLIALVLAGLPAALLWTPPSSRYFSYWDTLRQPQPAPERTTDPVVYGPLPRYR